jgi:hypothetical protein
LIVYSVGKLVALCHLRISPLGRYRPPFSLFHMPQIRECTSSRSWLYILYCHSPYLGCHKQVEFLSSSHLQSAPVCRAITTYSTSRPSTVLPLVIGYSRNRSCFQSPFQMDCADCSCYRSIYSIQNFCFSHRFGNEFPLPIADSIGLRPRSTSSCVRALSAGKVEAGPSHCLGAIVLGPKH